MRCLRSSVIVYLLFFIIDSCCVVQSEEISNDKQIKYPQYRVSSGFQPDQRFGQISAVTVNSNGNVVVFHRGPVVWNALSFSPSERYNYEKDPPISEETIVEMSPTSGRVVKKWGKNMFYMPHGLTIDHTGAYWLTDVALHQVFKFTSQDTEKASMTLGTRFDPGNDQKHLCKPTSVAIHTKSQDIFVADGYCNRRVIRFNSNGVYLNEFDATKSRRVLPNASPLNLYVPHKIVLIEESNVACVADRENGRVLCLNIDDGLVESIVKIADFNAQVFSLSYAPCLSGSLFIVDGPNQSNYSDSPRGYVFSLKTNSLIAKLPPDFSRAGPLSAPHDIHATPDCSQVFISEIGPNRVWKFGTDFFSLRDRAAVAEAEVISNISTDDPFWSRSSIISMLSLVVIVLAVAIRSYRQPLGAKLASLRSRFRSRSDTFDLSRLLEDPEKSGFNRVSTTETDMDADLSDSEVEEFNISSLRGNQRVTT